MAVVATFFAYSPLTYGLEMSNDQCEALKLHDSWHWSCPNDKKNVIPTPSDTSEPAKIVAEEQAAPVKKEEKEEKEEKNEEKKQK